MKAVSAASPRAKRGAHTVVLGCAMNQRGHMASLVEALASQEHHVELVSGIDESQQRWREAAQRYGTRAVYIMCGGPTVPPTALEALRAELRALGIPASSVWAGIIDWTQVDRLIRDVERMMEAVPAAVLPPPPLSRSSGPILVTPANNEPNPATPPPVPRSMARPASGPIPIATSSPPPVAAPPAAAPPPAPVHVAGPALVAGPSVAPNRLAPMGPSFETSSGQMPLPSPLAAPHPPSSLDPTSSSMELRMPSRRRTILASSAVAALGLVLLGWYVMGDDETPAPTKDSVAALEEPAPSSRPADTQPAPASAAEQPVGDQPAAEPSKPEPADEPSDEPAAEPAAEPSDEIVEADEAPMGDDDSLVHAALMQRKIRALDILLVSPEASKKIRRRKRVSHMSWADAHAYCEELDIDGVKGWRLPTAGEFRTLSGSNMLDRRSYWSATEADAFGSDRVVWNNLKKSMAPASGDWNGGRVLCVRFQHPEQFHPT